MPVFESFPTDDIRREPLPGMGREDWIELEQESFRAAEMDAVERNDFDAIWKLRWEAHQALIDYQNNDSEMGITQGSKEK